MFDTNKSYNENDIWDMFDKSKISAYGNASKFVNYLNAGDYVFYYHVGYGVVGVGMVKIKTLIVTQQRKNNTNMLI